MTAKLARQQRIVRNNARKNGHLLGPFKFRVAHCLLCGWSFYPSGLIVKPIVFAHYQTAVANKLLTR